MSEAAVKKDVVNITNQLKRNHHHLAAIMDRVERAKVEKKTKEG